MSTPLALAGVATYGGQGTFALVNLCGGGTYEFVYYPTAPITQGRLSNWEPQDTTIGTKPSFYMNRDGKHLDIGEVWMDRMFDDGDDDSLTNEIQAIYALQDETCQGAPPPLLAVWGDETLTCVLKEVTFEEHKHNKAGEPIRVKVILNLVEIQTS
ncbi:MAG TPA: hypothetical protein VI756_33230 [Blastocatellia bacterium]